MKKVLWIATFALLAVAGVAFAAGVIDVPTAMAGAVLTAEAGAVDLKTLEAAMKKAFDTMQDGIKRAQDAADKAVDEVKREGTLHGETSKKLTVLHDAITPLAGDFKKLRDESNARMLDIEQKLAKKPGGGGDQEKTAGQIVAESEELKRMLASGEYKMGKVAIPGGRKTIVNATGASQPLVQADRLPGIVVAPQRRLTVRDLLPTIPTQSNLIEFCRELVFTNNAGPQYDATSPTAAAEGVPKNQSNITFELASSGVVTMAHWIGASRQVLADAGMLRGYIDTRLGYGLKLVEEDDLLNADGTVGQITGLVAQATAFTGGTTNQTALDTILKAFTQVSMAEYEASGIVLNPIDWQNIMLAKDTTGRYLFSDPHSMEAPRVWGRPVVATQSLTAGTFLTGAFDLGASIYDREEMSIRASDQHADFFVRNLVAILCEERMALVVYRGAAFVTGNVSYAG